MNTQYRKKVNTMKRPFMAIFLILLIVVSMAACGQANGNSSGDSGSSPAASQTEQNTQENTSEPAQAEPSETAESVESVSQEQTEYLEAIPAAYFESSDQPGQVIQVTYESQDYTMDDTPITKPALVYLPYGYDENDTDTRYDILYLMHGWTMTANDFLGEGRSNLVNILDNLIASGDIPPVIVVSATFDAENQAQSFSRSVEELSVFHNDLRENLMTYIESRFHTYAEDVTEEGFEASREHREIWKEFVPQFQTIPAVNQVECNPFLQQKELRELLQQNDVKIEAYKPLGHGNESLLFNPVIQKLAEKYGKNAGQIIFRFEVQEGMIVLPKSTNPDRITGNIDIFDFELEESEMAELRGLDTGKGEHDPEAPGVGEMLLANYKVHD